MFDFFSQFSSVSAIGYDFHHAGKAIFQLLNNLECTLSIMNIVSMNDSSQQ